MGISGVVRDKDTEEGIADAVIAVDGINHDVTTGVCGGGVGETEGFWMSLKQRMTGPNFALLSPQHGVGITGGC